MATSPYEELPSYPQTYSAGTIAARLIDSLGFRYHWATRALSVKDLNHRPSPKARSTRETLQHIYRLSTVILHALHRVPNQKENIQKLDYNELRRRTLNNLKKSSDILIKAKDKDFENFHIIFGEKKIPFWNGINGPISDAIWHVGQIVSFRRQSGNPLNPRVDLFNGRLKPSAK